LNLGFTQTDADHISFYPTVFLISVSIYNAWLHRGRRAELHLFARGGHGFGMKQQGLPSDRWFELFVTWLASEGFVPEM